MSLPRFAGLASLVVALGFALAAAPGQEGDAKPPAKARTNAAVERQVYAVRGASAKDLANALSLHFQAEPAFRAVPDTASNTLLLSGPKAALEDALTVLREIDRPARTVHVEVICLELAGKAGGEADAKPLDRAELTGTAREVRAKVRDLQQKGVISSVKAVELTALAGQSARTQVSESRPFVTGVTGFGAGGGFGGGRGGGGGAGGPGAAGPGGPGDPAGPGPGGFGGGGGGGMTSRSISYRSVGMSVQVRPEVGADGEVTLDLHVEDATMRAAGGGVAVGADDKGAAIPAAEFVTSTLETRLKVRPGHMVLAQGTKAESKAGQARTIVLVSASTDEGGTKDRK